MTAVEVQRPRASFGPTLTRFTATACGAVLSNKAAACDQNATGKVNPTTHGGQHGWKRVDTAHC
jgi:hypothetical protein